MHTHTHIYTCTHTYIHMHTHTYTCTHTYIYTCTHRYTHTHTYTHAHTHIYVYMYIYSSGASEHDRNALVSEHSIVWSISPISTCDVCNMYMCVKRSRQLLPFLSLLVYMKFLLCYLVLFLL